MALPKQSFGYDLALAGKPSLKSVIDKLSLQLRQNGSLDQIAIELEAAGAAVATEMREVALRKLSKRISTQYKDAEAAVRWLAEQDRVFGAWAACVCAREALRLSKDQGSQLKQDVDTIEGWLAGTKSITDLEDARSDAYVTANKEFDAYDKNATASSAAKATAAASVVSAASAALNAAAYIDAREAYYKSVSEKSYAAANAAAALSVTHAANAASEACSAAAYDAAKTAKTSYGTPQWNAIRSKENRRLVTVIADALPGMPVRVR